MSLNVANVTNTATIGTGGHHLRRRRDVGARNDQRDHGVINDFSTQALGVAIGTQDSSVAGSAGINVITINTRPRSVPALS